LFDQLLSNSLHIVLLFVSFLGELNLRGEDSRIRGQSMAAAISSLSGSNGEWRGIHEDIRALHRLYFDHAKQVLSSLSSHLLLILSSIPNINNINTLMYVGTTINQSSVINWSAISS
jgi:hypothetical protein